jgi:hypothetical protein
VRDAGGRGSPRAGGGVVATAPGKQWVHGSRAPRHLDLPAQLPTRLKSAGSSG